MATAAVGFLIGLFNKSFIDLFNAFSLFSGVLILGILKYLIFAVLYLLSARKFRYDFYFDVSFFYFEYFQVLDHAEPD